MTIRLGATENAAAEAPEIRLLRGGKKQKPRHRARAPKPGGCAGGHAQWALFRCEFCVLLRASLTEARRMCIIYTVKCALLR